MHKGWDVEFVDLCGAAQFDFLARLGAVEIEIECKTTSGDTGRKIHRQEVNRLADQLNPLAEALVAQAGCHLLQIVIPDRLGKTATELTELVDLVRSAMDAGRSEDARGAVAYRLETTAWPEPAVAEDQQLRDFFEKRLGTFNSHLFFHVRPGHGIVAASITSRKPDKVVAALSTDAVHAAKQCSGTRPALIAMQLIDPIDREHLSEMLHTSNGLHKIAHAVFKNEARAHVNSIAFTTQQKRTAVSVSAARMSAPVLFLNNNRAKYPPDAVRSIFSP
jgi:hypothetical protein